MAAVRHYPALDIAWPSGLKESFQGLPANHLFLVHEGKGIVEKRPFGGGRS